MCECSDLNKVLYKWACRAAELAGREGVCQYDVRCVCVFRKRGLRRLICITGNRRVIFISRLISPLEQQRKNTLLIGLWVCVRAAQDVPTLTLSFSLSGGQGGVRTQEAEAPGGAGAAGGSSRVRLHVQTSLRVPHTHGYAETLLFNHLLSHTLFYFPLSTLFSCPVVSLHSSAQRPAQFKS